MKELGMITIARKCFSTKMRCLSKTSRPTVLVSIFGSFLPPNALKAFKMQPKAISMTSIAMFSRKLRPKKLRHLP